MRTKDSALKQKLRNSIPQSWHARLHVKDESSKFRRVGAHGLAALGTNAGRAVPALIEIAKRHPAEDGRYVAVFALRTLGCAAEPAIPFLIECLTNRVEIIRGDAALGLGAICRQPELAVPALVHYIDFAKTSPHHFECSDAVGAVGAFGTNASSAVPALLALLDHSDYQVRSSASNALLRIDPEAAARARIKR
jgi:HEAT repeat protein